MAEPIFTTRLTFGASPTTIVAGESITLFGDLFDQYDRSLIGFPVSIEQFVAAGYPWSTIWTGTTYSRVWEGYTLGHFEYKVQITKPGTYRFRAYFPGFTKEGREGKEGSALFPGVSSEVVVTVLPKEELPVEVSALEKIVGGIMIAVPIIGLGVVSYKKHKS